MSIDRAAERRGIGGPSRPPCQSIALRSVGGLGARRGPMSSVESRFARQWSVARARNAIEVVHLPLEEHDGLVLFDGGRARRAEVLERLHPAESIGCVERSYAMKA